MKKENLRPFTKKRFIILKNRCEEAGYKVVTKYRKGIKSIRLGDIILSEK